MNTRRPTIEEFQRLGQLRGIEHRLFAFHEVFQDCLFGEDADETSALYRPALNVFGFFEKQLLPLMAELIDELERA